MIDEEDLSIARIDILYSPSSLWHKRAARFISGYLRGA